MGARSARVALAVVMGLVLLASGMGASAAPAGESVLRIYMVGDARTLDPAVASDFPTASNAYLLHLRLVSMDGAGRVHPMGARSWTVTGGGLVYAFDLDPRAKFHNGKPVTAMLAKPHVRGFEGSPLSLGWTYLTGVEIRR